MLTDILLVTVIAAIVVALTYEGSRWLKAGTLAWGGGSSPTDYGLPRRPTEIIELRGDDFPEDPVRYHSWWEDRFRAKGGDRLSDAEIVEVVTYLRCPEGEAPRTFIRVRL